eukprot:gene22374-biopygen8753
MVAVLRETWRPHTGTLSQCSCRKANYQCIVSHLRVTSTLLDRRALLRLVLQLPYPNGRNEARDLGTRDTGARDLGARDLGARDPGARDPGARDLGARDLGVRVLVA